MHTRRKLLSGAAGAAAGMLARATPADAKTQVVSLLNGRGVPRKGFGIVGDFYIDNVAHAIYGPKRKSGWGVATGLIGPAGPAGPAGLSGVAGVTGSTGEAGAVGVQGYSILSGDGPPSASEGVDYDFYIDTSTTQLYGPKEGGVWGSPISLTGSANVNAIDGGAL